MKTTKRHEPILAPKPRLLLVAGTEPWGLELDRVERDEDARAAGAAAAIARTMPAPLPPTVPARPNRSAIVSRTDGEKPTVCRESGRYAHVFGRRKSS